MNDQQQIDQLITTFFSIFDNRNGNEPDLTQLHALFCHNAIITKVDENSIETMTLPQFIAPRQQMLQAKIIVEFHEWEDRQQTLLETNAANIATRISHYRKQGIKDGTSFEGSGNKHIQLIKTPQGWRINSIIWQDE